MGEFLGLLDLKAIELRLVVEPGEEEFSAIISFKMEKSRIAS